MKNIMELFIAVICCIILGVVVQSTIDNRKEISKPCPVCSCQEDKRLPNYVNYLTKQHKDMSTNFKKELVSVHNRLWKKIEKECSK